MSTRNSRTANSHEMSDSLTKLQLEKDDLFELFVENDSELKEGDYEGEVLAMQRVPGTKFYKAMIRVPQLHDSQIPTAVCQDEPTRNPRFSNAQQKLLIYNHICAISESPMGNTESDTDTSAPNEEQDAIFCQQMVSTKVLVRFKQSPNQKGKTRFAKFRMPTITSQPSKNANGCYNMDCPETLVQSLLGGTFADFLGGSNGGGFLFEGGGNPGGAGGNPSHSTKLHRVKGSDGKMRPVAWTVKPWVGKDYADIADCPYNSSKQPYFADEINGKPHRPAPTKTPPEVGEAKGLKGKKTTLLGREFMKLLASKLSFDITMTSNFRGAQSNAKIMADTTFDYFLGRTKTLDQYGKKKAKYKSLYKKVKKQTGEANPKHGGPTYKLLLSEIKKFYPKKTGHSVGGAVDISSKRLSRQQVSDLMYTCYYMRVGWVMLEHHVPHVHVSITKDVKAFPKASDYNDPAKVKALLEKYDKRYKKNAPAQLPSTGTSGGGSKSTATNTTSTATTSNSENLTIQELNDSASSLFNIVTN